MHRLKRYIQDCFREAVADYSGIDEETSSTDKKDGVESAQSTWDVEFKVGGNPDANVMNAVKTDKPMKMGFMLEKRSVEH